MTKSQSVLYTNVYSVLMQRSSAMYSFQVSVFTRVHLIGNGDIAFTTNSQSSNLLDWCQATFTQFQSQPMFQSTDFAWHRKPSVVMTTARKPLDVVGHSKAALILAIALRCHLIRQSSPQMWRSNPQIWRSSPQTTLVVYSQPALSHLDAVSHSKAALTLATAVQL